MNNETQALYSRAVQHLDIDDADKAAAMVDFAAMLDDIAGRYGDRFAHAVVAAMLDAMGDDPDGFLNLPQHEAAEWLTARIPSDVWDEGQRQLRLRGVQPAAASARGES